MLSTIFSVTSFVAAAYCLICFVVSVGFPPKHIAAKQNLLFLVAFAVFLSLPFAGKLEVANIVTFEAKR